MGFTPSGAHLFDLCAVSETIKASASGIAMAVVETVCGMCGSDVCGIDVHVEGQDCQDQWHAWVSDQPRSSLSTGRGGA